MEWYGDFQLASSNANRDGLYTGGREQIYRDLNEQVLGKPQPGEPGGG